MASHVSIKERVEQAEKLAEENGGKLSRMADLRKTHPQIVSAYYRRPEAFAHIAVDTGNRKSEAAWKAYALEVASANGGVLPAHVDLRVTHPDLASILYRKPLWFADITRATTTRAKQARLAKHVQKCEGLAAELGYIVLGREFQKSHPALLCAMRANPEAFAHIPRKQRETKTVEDHVAFAETLKDEDGLLPPCSVMKRKYPALRTMMQNHPESFKGFRLRSLIQTIADHVSVAERMASENGGKLQSRVWLLKNGYRNLVSAMARKPESFALILQEV